MTRCEAFSLDNYSEACLVPDAANSEADDCSRTALRGQPPGKGSRFRFRQVRFRQVRFRSQAGESTSACSNSSGYGGLASARRMMISLRSGFRILAGMRLSRTCADAARDKARHVFAQSRQAKLPPFGGWIYGHRRNQSQRALSVSSSLRRSSRRREVK